MEHVVTFIIHFITCIFLNKTQTTQPQCQQYLPPAKSKILGVRHVYTQDIFPSYADDWLHLQLDIVVYRPFQLFKGFHLACPLVFHALKFGILITVKIHIALLCVVTLWSLVWITSWLQCHQQEATTWIFHPSQHRLQNLHKQPRNWTTLSTL
jgi:hypothetical protein